MARPKISHVNVNGGFGGMAVGLSASNPDVETVLFYETAKPCRYMLEHYWDVPVHSKLDEFIKGVRKHAKNRPIDIVSAKFRKSRDWKVAYQTISAAKPRVVVIEGMASLRSRGLVRILKDLWTLGYDAEGHVISACSVGAVYKGERYWLIAHAYGDGFDEAGQHEEIEGAVGKQFITDDLLDEYRIQFERRRAEAGRPVFDQPRVLRRDDRFSRRVDAARVRFLSDDVSPIVAGFVGFCLSRVLDDDYRSLPVHQLSLVDQIHNVAKKTNLVMNTNMLDAAKIPYDKKNEGVHLVIKTKSGKTIDYWPSTDVFLLRGTETRGFGCKNVISGYATF